MMYFHKDMFDDIVKQLEQNIEGEAFWRTTNKNYYMDWLQKMFEQYKSYIIQEYDRTGRAPISHLKNFKALLSEQGQVNPAQAVQEDIDRFTEH